MSKLDGESLSKCKDAIARAKDILLKEGLEEDIDYFFKEGKPSSNGVVRNWSFALSMHRESGKLGPVFFRVRPEQEYPVKVSKGKVFLEYFDPDRNMQTNSYAPLNDRGGKEDNYVYRKIDVATHVFSKNELRFYKEALLTALSRRKSR